jgi:hypothetical protein
MKTCKTGCGKMKAGGSVKKLAKGGQALNKAKGFAKQQTGGDNVSKNIFGVPNAGTTGPNRTGTYDYKKGGSTKAKGCPEGYYWTVQGCEKKGPGYKGPLSSISSRIGVGAAAAGIIGTGIKTISDKVKAKKAAKKAAEEAKKNETPKAKFGASTPVKASCKQGMVRGADGKCVMSRPKFKSGGSFGMLSVKAGIDKNPKPTAADRIAGAKMNKKRIGGSIKRK